MCYLDGTTDRSFTISNRQAVHKYGQITLHANDGAIVTEPFNDNYQQIELERKFRGMKRNKFKDEATVYLTFRSRMNTRKASAFLDEVAEKVGFKMDGKMKISGLAA